MENNNFNTPFVSICCIAYNHAAFIAQAMDSFLMQKTTFPIEIIIHDDASTDNTANIIKEYALKHPNLIFPIFQNENQYSKGINPGTEYVIPRCKGKYIAVCEGDDYWIDPFKLQKQVDFLEANHEHGLVFTDADHYQECQGKMIRAYDKTFRRKIPSGDVLSVFLQGINPYKTCTAVFRSSFIKEYKEIASKHSLIMGDKSLWLLIAGKAKIGYINKSTSVYRIKENSVSHSDELEVLLKFLKSSYKATVFFSSYYNRPFERKKNKQNCKKAILIYCASKKKYKQLFYYARCFPLAIATILKEFLRDLIVWVTNRKNKSYPAIM
jgi:glycosyltransferase involved in cell wall biosynthesis